MIFSNVRPFVLSTIQSACFRCELAAGPHPLPCLLSLDFNSLFTSYHHSQLPSAARMPRSGRSKRSRRFSSKRKRSPAGSGSENDDVAPSSSSVPVAGPLSFDAFLAMPEEIRSLILELAYSHPSSTNDASDSSGASIESLDAATTINLACSSRWFNVQATLRLYTHVAITRPSALASLQRAIALRPQLGRLIKSLHIGAWDPLPESWYPLRSRPGFVDDKGNPHPTTTLILTSLSNTEDLPEGCTPGQGWSFEHPGLDRRSMALSRVLLAAQKSLDVDLRGMHNWWFSVSKQKLFLVQAALDLYLIAMRRFEKREDRSADLASPNASLPGGHDASPDYPALLIVDARDENKTSDMDKACVLTRQQLTQHLARPRGPTDRFDHPLLFARSGLDQLSETYRRDNLYRCQPDDRFMREPEDLADIFESKRGLETPGGASRVSEEVLDPSLPGTATIGALLTLTRSLLAMTPRLENLSLTGFLERAVCGRRPTASLLKSLRCLSIGPPPETSEWYVPLLFEGLEEIQKLRVCGTMLRGDEVAQISGRYSELQWSLADQLSAEDVKT